MTDLEITQWCAKAMGWRPAGTRKDFDTVKCIPVEQFPGACHYQYAPLKDDQSAMALVKRFRLGINAYNAEYQVWSQSGKVGAERAGESCAFNVDLNRAICECVAKLMASGGEQGPQEDKA